MARGGKRPGAGAKKGVAKNRRLDTFFSKQEIRDLVSAIKKGAKKNPKMQMFLFEHIFGKARQSLDFGDDFTPTQIIITGNAKRSN